MQKKYLAPWMQVQVFDEETLATEYGDDQDQGTFNEGDDDSGVTDGEEDWFQRFY